MRRDIYPLHLLPILTCDQLASLKKSTETKSNYTTTPTISMVQMPRVEPVISNTIRLWCRRGQWSHPRDQNASFLLQQKFLCFLPILADSYPKNCDSMRILKSDICPWCSIIQWASSEHCKCAAGPPSSLRNQKLSRSGISLKNVCGYTAQKCISAIRNPTLPKKSKKLNSTLSFQSNMQKHCPGHNFDWALRKSPRCRTCVVHQMLSNYNQLSAAA